MNILIINQPLNNRGDESAHKGLLRELLKCTSGINVKVLFLNEKESSIDAFRVIDQRVKYINIIPQRGWKYIIPQFFKYNRRYIAKLHPTSRKILNEYCWADYILCAPGGISMGGFQNWTHLFLLHLAKYCYKPLAYYGRSFGPFPIETESNRLFKKLSLEMLDYFSFISIRDKKTEQIAKEMEIDFISTVDTAFLDNPYVELPLEVKTIIDERPYVVCVPNSLVWHYAYRKYTKQQSLEFFSKIIEMTFNKFQNHNIILLPQTFNCGSELGNDINFFYELQKFMKREGIIVLQDTYSSDIQQMIISKAKCVVGARYHSVVFSLNQAVPFVALSYEHKICGLLEALGKTDCMVNIEDVFASKENEEIILEKFIKAIDQIKPDNQACCNAKKIAKVCFEKYIKMLTYES